MKKLFLFLFLFLFLNKSSYALIPLEKIKSNDRILIVAPHPDDEILATGGVIQEALKDKAKVKVLYITDGEHNIPSLVFYGKFLFRNKKREVVIDLGKIRKAESISACKILGLSRKDLIFLGYPDSGILPIFIKHWGSEKPFIDSLSKSTAVEKDEGISPGAIYMGESILSDIERVLLNFKPTKIFLPSPEDRNPDHVGSYLFLKLALLELKEKLNPPELYLYIVHRKHISILERYNPEFFLKFPVEVYPRNNWVVFKLTSAEKERKRRAILRFKSQMYCKKFLLSFVQDELFNKESLVMGCIEKQEGYKGFIFRKGKKIGEYKIFLKDDSIELELRFFKKINPISTRGKIYLLGYNYKVKFGNLPKIYLNFRDKRWNLYNKDRRIKKSKRIRFQLSRKYLKIRVPLSILGNPQYLFTAVDISSPIYDFYLPWQIVKIKME